MMPFLRLQFLKDAASLPCPYSCNHVNQCQRAISLLCLLLQVQALPSGAITLSFGAKSDPLSQDISALVLHLYNSEVKHEVTTGKAPALAAVTEVCMVHSMYGNIL